MYESRLFIFLAASLVFLAACNGSSPTRVVPTIASPSGIQTANFKTQNAPPTGFGQVAFNPIDAGRDQLPGSYFEVTVNFQGQYTQTAQAADGILVMRVWENGLQRARRVVLEFEGEALSGGVTRVEAVRLGNDFFLVDANGTCTQGAQTASDIANLSAGQVIGGVTLAFATGHQRTINIWHSYQYGFNREALSITIFREPPGAVEATGGEIWVAPEIGIVTRMGAALTVHNARVLFGSQPVTGALDYRYELLEISTSDVQAPNITQPNGC